MPSLEELYVDVDDFILKLQQQIASNQLGEPERRGRKPKLSDSEVMTIVIYFHCMGFRNFKTYYLGYVCRHLSSEFPTTVSYNRFVERMAKVLIPLCIYMRFRLGVCTGISFVDATPLVVCHNKRISRHRVFVDHAQRGKTSMGWFYGFKLHLIINDRGEILAFCITPGNVDDRKPVPKLVRDLWGKLFGDKGYLSQPLATQLRLDGIDLVTPIRKNMQNKLLPLYEKLLLRKRAIIETVIDQLKNISQVDHSRHRSVFNFAVNLVAGLIAYSFRPKKPSLNLSDSELATLPALISFPN